MSRSYMLEALLLLLAGLIKVHAKLKCSNDLLMCLEMSCNDLTEENIEKNKDKINNLDNEGKAALHYAVQSGSLRCVKLLLEYGADANIKNSDGQTGLHLVYDEEWGCEECTLSLLEGGADPSTTDNDGQTAMFNLNLYKCPECMHQMIKWGGNIDAKRKDGENSLCQLVDQDEEIVKDVYMPYLNTLKELCADPTIKCSDGMTAIQKAQDLEHKYLVDVLEDYANKFQCKRNETKEESDCVCKDGHLKWENMDGGYPYYPILGGECHADTIQKKLQNSLDTEATDTNGHTGLINAVINKQRECVEVLLNHSLDVNHPDDKGKAALWYALKNCKSCSNDGIALLLLKKGANPYDIHGCSFLMDNKLKICDECIEMLCKNGIDPLKECVDRGNPLHHICEDDVYMEPLIKHCSLATVKSKTTNKTALWYALKNCGGCQKDGCVQKLLKKGSKVDDYTTEEGCNIMMDKDLNICDQCVRLMHSTGYDIDGHVNTCTEGGYPLIWWCKNTDRNINVLLEFCPNIEKKDEEGKTAMEVSKDMENEECIKSIDSYRKRSECTLGDVKQTQCDEEIQHKCVCKNSTALWNPPLHECNSMKNKDSLHGGTGCMVNGVLKEEGVQWFEDCWIYECKEGKLVNTLNPSCNYYMPWLRNMMNLNLMQNRPMLAQPSNNLLQPNPIQLHPIKRAMQLNQNQLQSRPIMGQVGQWASQSVGQGLVQLELQTLSTCITGHQAFVNNCQWPLVASFIKIEMACPFFKCILPTSILNRCLWHQYLVYHCATCLGSYNNIYL